MYFNNKAARFRPITLRYFDIDQSQRDPGAIELSGKEAFF